MWREEWRIHNAPLTQLAKFPYYLPPRNPFTTLVVYMLHMSNSITWSWNYSYNLVPVLLNTNRQTVCELSHFFANNVVCRKHSGKLYIAPDPAPLLKVRKQDVHPFSVTGIDFTGALYVCSRSEETKI